VVQAKSGCGVGIVFSEFSQSDESLLTETDVEELES